MEPATEAPKKKPLMWGVAKKKEDVENKSNKVTAGKLRVQYDMTEYNEDPIKNIQIRGNEADPMKYEIEVTPTSDSLYHGGTYLFTCEFKETYPIDPPKVLMKHVIFHPNIDTSGNICLPMVKEEWKPTNTLYGVICGLIYLFGNPNAKDPLNVEAGTLMNDNYTEFVKVVKETLRGGSYKGKKYDRMIK